MALKDLGITEETSPSYDYISYEKEWKVCRSTTDKLDGILVDLRKYGFSFLTGLTTAGSFLGFASPQQNIQIGVIIVTMVLVVVLYWLDNYYQKLLFGSVFRGRFLEIFRINKGLTNYISGLYGAGHIGGILHSLYIGFLIGLFVLGLFVINFLNAAKMTNAFFTLVGAFIFAFAGIIILYIFSYRKLTNVTKEISTTGLQLLR